MLLLWIKVDSFIPIILPNLNPICHLLALGAHHILHVGRIRFKDIGQKSMHGFLHLMKSNLHHRIKVKDIA
jgi:hypothetical protein